MREAATQTQPLRGPQEDPAPGLPWGALPAPTALRPVVVGGTQDDAFLWAVTPISLPKSRQC